MRTAHTSTRTSARNWRHRAGFLLLASASLLAISGCTPRYAEVKGYLVADPSERHPIKITKRHTIMKIDVRRGDKGMTKKAKWDWRAFVDHYRKNGTGKLFIKAPTGAPNEVAVRRVLNDMRVVLQEMGINRSAIVFTPVVSDYNPEAPIRVSYRRFVATGPECGDWSDNMARNPRNLPYRNFGCATQQNMAAMIDNPRDLVTPRGMDDRYGPRRDTLFDKYVKGEDTTSAKSKDQGSTASDSNKESGTE